MPGFGWIALFDYRQMVNSGKGTPRNPAQVDPRVNSVHRTPRKTQ